MLCQVSYQIRNDFQQWNFPQLCTPKVTRDLRVDKAVIISRSPQFCVEQWSSQLWPECDGKTLNMTSSFLAQISCKFDPINLRDRQPVPPVTDRLGNILPPQTTLLTPPSHWAALVRREIPTKFDTVSQYGFVVRLESAMALLLFIIVVTETLQKRK